MALGRQPQFGWPRTTMYAAAAALAAKLCAAAGNTGSKVPAASTGSANTHLHKAMPEHVCVLLVLAAHAILEHLLTLCINVALADDCLVDAVVRPRTLQQQPESRHVLWLLSTDLKACL